MAEVIALVTTPQPPAQLAELKAWLVWRFEDNGGKKPRKVPYYADDFSRRRYKHGSDQDVVRLVTFGEALAAQRKHRADGVGFACLPHFNITALDFDHCADGAAHVLREVRDVIKGTYAELSPSGTGVRAFFIGSLANGKSIGDDVPYGFEVFHESGFVTYTGNTLDLVGLEPEKVIPITPAVTRLYRQRIGEGRKSPESMDPLMTHTPRIGLSFEQMRKALRKINPDVPYPEWRNICFAIAHETEASDEGCSLMHQWSSGELQGREAEKYNENVAERVWDSATNTDREPMTFRSVLWKAKQSDDKPNVAGAPHDSEPAGSRYRIITAAEYLKRPPPAWLIKGVVPEAALGVIYGAPGSGKSFLALDLAASIARGVTWRGRRVKQTRALYVAAEGAGGFRNRIDAYIQARGELSDDFGFLPESPNFLDDEDPTELIAAVGDFGDVGIVVLDTLAQITPGGNENSAEDMGNALAQCKRLHDALGCLVILVHHSGKDETRGARGWSGLKGAADFELEVRRRKASELRIVRVTKLKDGADGAEFGFDLEKIALDPDADGDIVQSCVVREADIADEKIQPEKLPRWQGAVYRVIDEACGLAGGGLSRQAVIDEAILIEEKPEKGRDRRPECARRAIADLIRQELIVENGGFLELA